MTESLTTEAASLAQTGWQGVLNITYVERKGTTQIIDNYAQAPLKVQRPFYPEGKEVCHSVILHTAGGVVGGDRLSQNFCLEAGAQALITTAAAGKIYRSNGKKAKQTIKIKIEEGAILEWLPQETIIFNRANYQQDLRIELASKSCVLLWEINRLGRTARGERFLSGEWRSQTEIWQDGRPLWIDRQLLLGNEAMLDSAYCLAGQPVVATLAWLGQPVTAELLEKVRALWQEGDLWQAHPTYSDLRQDACPRDEIPPHLAGVTRLTNGLLCRYRGVSTAAARNWFVAVWHLLRLSFRERPACLPRVWPQ